MKQKVKLLDEGYRDGEWANQFYTWVFLVGDERVEIWRNLLRRGDWEVIWDGTVDFHGTKKELIKRYPEFRGYL